jgi:hypothetical protein
LNYVCDLSFNAVADRWRLYKFGCLSCEGNLQTFGKIQSDKPIRIFTTLFGCGMVDIHTIRAVVLLLWKFIQRLDLGIGFAVLGLCQPLLSQLPKE